MPAEILHPLEALMRERIVVLDGAMGTMVQQLQADRSRLSRRALSRLERQRPEGEHRASASDQARRHRRDPHANISRPARTSSRPTLSAPRPSACTIFSFTANQTNGRKDPEFFQRVVDDADFRDLAQEINVAAARMARHAADKVANETGQRRFVAGSLGPAAGDRVAFARCERSRFSRGHVRSNPTSLSRPGRRRCSKAASIF